MTLSLALAFLWVIAANVAAVIPSRDRHWTRAMALVVVGIPLLGYLTFENGPWVGLLALFAGISILRWPARFLCRWVGRYAGFGI